MSALPRRSDGLDALVLAALVAAAKFGKSQSDLKAAGDEAAAKIAALDGLRAANSGDMKRAG